MKSTGLRLFALSVLALGIASSGSVGQEVAQGKKHPGKLGSLLSQVAEAQEDAGDDKALTRAEGLGLRVQGRGARAEVTVILEPLDGRDADSIDRADVTKLGGTVTGESKSFLRVRVPLRSLRRLGTHAGVRLVRSPTASKALDGLGSNLSESVALTGAGSLQEGGITGAGIKVAVVDLGFIGLTATISAGELPANTVKVLLPGQVGSTYVESGTEHGTGVAEHVADMAPGARIYCIRVEDEVDLQNAAAYCQSNGIRVANHSIGWVNSSYYDGTGPISSIINNSYNAGVLWCVAAGNDADRHWRGAWADSDGDRFLDLGNGPEDFVGLQGSTNVVQLFLNWNQYGNSANDLDLYVYNRLNQLVTYSVGSQNGPQPPTESLAFFYSASAAPYHVRVYRYGGAAVPPTLNVTLFSFNHTLSPAVASSSLMDPACAPGAFAVGAIDQADYAQESPPLESYSSQGPTTDGRPKPEIAAPDGTTSRTYGFQSSFGTSFASPTTAGAAALLMHQNPSLTTPQVVAALKRLAVDIGAPGPDSQSGAGKLALTTNGAPTANDQSVETAVNTPAAITLSGSDLNGDPLTYEIVPESGPFLGTLSGTAPNLTYTPDAGISGSDSFMFRVDDGIVDSLPATVSLTITAGNRPPVANGQSVTTPRDAPVAITLVGSDPDGDSLTYSIVAPPANGVLSGAAPGVTYSPNAGFTGPDGFTFKVNDGTVDSAPAAVSITVTRPNAAPVANAQSVTTAEDTPAAVTLSGSDADGDPLTYTVVSPPTRGTLTGSAPNLTYTPDANAHGPDGFTFKVNDGLVDSAPATVSITVTPVNDAPVANGQSAATAEDTAVAITLSGADVDGDSLTYAVVGPPAGGTLSGTAPNLVYTPDANAVGPDSFTFKVNDGLVDSALATVSITVTPVNDAPVADGQSVATAEDTAAAVTLTGSDAEGSALTYSVVTGPAKGTLSGAAPNLTYTPNANTYGADSFTFRVNDGVANSNVAMVSIAVAPVNDAPVANSRSVTTGQGTPVSITLTGSDADGDALTYGVMAAPAHGTLSGTAPALTYTPAAGYSGPDSFTFKVNDGTVDSGVATVSITVTPPAPVTLASDGFESGTWTGGAGAWAGGWVKSGDASIVESGGPHGGLRHARLRRGTGYIRRAVTLSGQTSVHLKFWAKATSFEAGDTADVKVSTDGTNWTTVKTFTSADGNVYASYDLVVSVSGAATLHVAFDANMSGPGDTWYLDDLQVTN